MRVLRNSVLNKIGFLNFLNGLSCFPDMLNSIENNLSQWRNATAGGPPSIGHFWPPFAPLRRPPPPSPKNFRSVYHFGRKNFFGHTPIFPKYENIFPETPKNFPDIWYFSPKLKHFFRNPRNVLSNFLWSFLSGGPKVRGPPVTGHPDTLPLRHWP
jgi:hypothetical protein